MLYYLIVEDDPEFDPFGKPITTLSTLLALFSRVKGIVYCRVRLSIL
jgi:hypothetical protein